MSSVTKFLFRKLKENTEVRALLERTEFFSDEQIYAFQCEKLAKLINHAYNSIPYYRDLFDDLQLKPSDIKTPDDLKKLPILTKDIIRNAPEKFIDASQTKYYQSHTSGSTGKPLVIKRNEECKVIENELFNRFQRSMGYQVGDRSIDIWGRVYANNKAKFKEVLKKRLLNITFFNAYDLDDNLDKVLDKLVSNLNVHIRAFSSSLFKVAQEMNIRGMSLNIKSMSVSVEQLFTEQRKIINKVLGPNLYDQYGSGEVQSIAFECNHHKGLHHAFEHSVLEVLDDNGNPTTCGRVIITNLDNTVMPLIRYENGDLVELESQKCSCGRSGLVIKKVMGRQFDIIKGANGEILDGPFVEDVILRDDILEQCKFTQYRFVQVSASAVRLDYVAPLVIPEKYSKIITSLLQQKLGADMAILFSKKDKLLLSAGGKRRFVVSLEEYNRNTNLYQ